MKTTAKKYAQALFFALEGKNETESKDVISRFVKVLAENKDFNKAEKVLEYFGEIWNKENGIVAVDVTTAKKMSEDISSVFNDYVAKMFDARNVEMNLKVDKNIIGGIVVKQGDKIYDGSLKSRLYLLKEKLTK